MQRKSAMVRPVASLVTSTSQTRVVGARPVHRGAQGGHALAVFFDALETAGNQAVRGLI